MPTHKSNIHHVCIGDANEFLVLNSVKLTSIVDKQVAELQKTIS